MLSKFSNENKFERRREVLFLEGNYATNITQIMGKKKLG